MTDQSPDVVTVYRDHAGAWRWRRKAPNGEIVSESSEGYLRKYDCYNEARRELGETVVYVFSTEVK